GSREGSGGHDAGSTVAGTGKSLHGVLPQRNDELLLLLPGAPSRLVRRSARFSPRYLAAGGSRIPDARQGADPRGPQKRSRGQRAPGKGGKVGTKRSREVAAGGVV